MQFEDLGFCEKGEGADFVRQHTASPSTATFRSTRRADSSRSDRPARPAAISVWSRRCGSSPAAALGAQVENARLGLVCGFGMINYDRGLCIGRRDPCRAAR